MENEELDRIPVYWAWGHFNADFRAVLIRAAMRPSDQIDYQGAAHVEWVDLPEHIRAGIMGQFRELARIRYDQINKPDRVPALYMIHNDMGRV